MDFTAMMNRFLLPAPLRRLFLLVALAAGFQAQAQSFNLVYGFGSASSGDFGPDAVVSNLTATPMTNGAGAIESAFGGARTAGASSWHQDLTAPWTPDSDYFGFTLTAGSGYTMDLTGISVGWLNKGPGMPISFYLTSSVTGFSTVLATATLGASETETSIPTTFLSSSFESLATSVTFRIYGDAYDSANTWTGDPHSYQVTIDSVQVSGTLQAAAIPEPSTCSMIAGMAVLGLAAWRRARTT